MSLVLPTGRTLVAVNSTEWRNLCARGAIRLLRNRPVWIPDDAEAGDFSRMFAAAPTTKIDSSVDLLVLHVRDDWQTASASHPSNEGVGILRLGDVLAHSLVAEEHLDYYRTEAAKAAVEIAGADFEHQWRRWMVDEMTSAALESAAALATHLGVPASETDSAAEGASWRHVVESVITGIVDPAIRSTAVGTLLRHATSIDDGAASIRGTEAFAVACCIEWIDALCGVDALDSPEQGPELLEAIATLRTIDLVAGQPLSADGEKALTLLETAYPDAFPTEIPASAVSLFVNLLVTARLNPPSPDVLLENLKRVAGSPHAGMLAAVLAAAVLGPERTLGLLRILTSDTDGALSDQVTAVDITGRST